MTRRVLVPAAALFVTLMGSIVPAGADPSRNAFPLTLDCGAAGSPTVMVFSNGRSAGLDVASNSVFIPSSVDFTATFYPDYGDPVIADEEHWTKPGKMTGISTISCTFEFTDTVDDGTFVNVGEVTGFQSPRG